MLPLAPLGGGAGACLRGLALALALFGGDSRCRELSGERLHPPLGVRAGVLRLLENALELGHPGGAAGEQLLRLAEVGGGSLQRILTGLACARRRLQARVLE